MPLAAGNIITYDGSQWVNQNYVSGSLGIGLATAPSYKLDIATDNSQYPVGIRVQASTHASSRRAAINLDTMQLGKDYPGNGTNDFFIWDHNASALRLIISSSGNLGIGTATPVYKLDVWGSGNNNTSGSIRAKNTADDTAAAALVAVESGTTDAASGYLGAFSNAYTNISAFQKRLVVGTNSDAAGLTLSAGSSGQDIRFLTGSTSNERMRVDASGNIGIGTTSPTHALTLPNGSTGIALYNTADQTTNYERVAWFWSSNVATLRVENGGSGTARDLGFKSAFSTVNSIVLPGNPSGTQGIVRVGTNFSNVSQPTFEVGGGSNVTTGSIIKRTLLGATFNPTSASSMLGIGVAIEPSINYSAGGGGSYEGLRINATETALPSGSNFLFRAGSGGGSYTSSFDITNAGNVGLGMNGSSITAKLTFASSTIASGGILFGADSNLYRSAADTIKTDDRLIVGGGLDNEQTTALSGDISPTGLTGDVDDYNPSGLSTSTVLRVNPNGAARQITGIAGGADGRVLVVCNIATDTAQTLTLVHEGGSSTAANRIVGANAANVVIRAGGSCVLWYDSSSSRWRTVAI